MILSNINAKKHSLSHQLTAQLHIENSKNKTRKLCYSKDDRAMRAI